MKKLKEVWKAGTASACKSIYTTLFLTFTFLLSYAQDRPVDMVYPLLDAAHSRWFYFASASLPFGMVSLFPDTNISAEWNSGYRYAEDTIRCFSHIHEWQLSGVPVMPVVLTDNNMQSVFNDFSSSFTHEKEKVKPGFHAVHLERYNILAELTASQRAGFHRYTYPPAAQAGVIFDLGGHLGPSDMLSAGFSSTSRSEIRGFMVNGPTFRRPKPAPVYFSAIFNKPIREIYLLDSGGVKKLDKWEGGKGRVLLLFDAVPDALLMKVGVSFTSEQGAAANVSAEIPHWNFDRVTQDAAEKWNGMLERIKIEGGTQEQRCRFYTDLYHAIQGRRIVSDADGKYADFTGAQKVIRQLPLDKHKRPKFNMYNSDSFWGAQWTLNTLWHLVYPDITEEFCNAFLEYYKNSGFIPRGPSGGNDTFVMTGAPLTPFFVSAWQKGIRGFNIDLAYEGLKKNHMPGGAMSKAGYEHQTSVGGGLDYYLNKGYVPYPLPGKKEYGFHQDGAGMTLEYAYQDWALAQLSEAIGKTEDHAYFLKRSQNYNHLFNPRSGFIQPKNSVGNWKEPFDPLLYDNGYIEGNAAQFTWFVPHDMQNLFVLLGGKSATVARLNREFELSAWHRFCNEDARHDPKFVNDKRTWINYSNQPGMHAAFIFNHAGAPWLTQYWSREVVNHVYSSLSPYEGYHGDEDQGLMGSLSVLMKLGIFQMTGGCESNPAYDIGSPVFDAVSIRLHPSYYKGTLFRIETKNTSNVNRYITSATLNGKPHNSFQLRHSDITAGGKLVLQMSDTPNKTWGNDKTH